MKKTVIAAALVSTVFSGAAMAWTANGTGGNVEIGGNIQISPYNTPFEVMVGAPATALNANITKGVRDVLIPVTTTIPVMGIRTVSKQAIMGGAGITPQLNYNGAIDTTKFTNSVTTLTLDVKDASDAKIGVMTAPLSAAGIFSFSSPVQQTQSSLFGSDSSLFTGGLSSLQAGGLSSSAAARSLINNINPEFLANYNGQGAPDTNEAKNYGFTYLNLMSTAYGAGILANSNITLKLNTVAANDAIVWKASLPITVSYR